GNEVLEDRKKVHVFEAFSRYGRGYLRMSKFILQRMTVQPRIERHHHSAKSRYGQQRDEPLLAVRQIDCNPITFLYAKLRHRCGKRCAGGIYLCVCSRAAPAFNQRPVCMLSGTMTAHPVEGPILGHQSPIAIGRTTDTTP